MFHHIRWRIAVPYVLLILISMTALGVYVSNFVRQTYLNDLESELLAEARLAAEGVAPLLAAGTPPSELDALAKRWAELLGTRLTVVAADGSVVGESHEDRATMENHAARPEIAQALSSGAGSSTRYSQTVGYQMMYTAVPVLHEGTLVGYMRVALPLREVQENLNHLQRTLIGATLLVTLLAVALAMLIASRTVRPLQSLTQAAGQLASGGLDENTLAFRIPPTSQDEVGQLTRAFNRMAARLQQQFGELESERSKMATVLNQMSDGVLIVDAQGLIQLVNPAVESMFGLDRGAGLNRSLAEVLRHHELVELWRKSRETGQTQRATVEIGARGLYIESVATPLGAALPGSTLLLLQDLTHVRRLETIRQDFISNVSHELRTPLASIKALTETLMESALDDPPAARRFLQLMETEVDSLSLMVAELLELSRIESGRVPLQLAPTEVEKLIQQSVERLRLQAERAGLTLEIEVPPGMPPVLADRQRIEQVLVNLLHNAIKFTLAGGRITVRAARQGGEVHFAVQDTGVGIPAEELPRIFERFYKTDRARAGGGTGLGLAISRHLVESHQGRIWAESREGKGSTFTFALPVA